MFTATLFSLISVINPFGTLPIFLGLTSGFNKSELSKTALKASFISVLIFVITYFLGQYILNFFNISIMSLKISGGFIIFLSGLSLLRGKFTAHKGMDKRVKDDAYTKEDPSFTPLAIPMLAGPGSMSFLITLQAKIINFNDHLKVISIIIICSLIIFIILSSARVINKKLGASGLNSLSRVIGFIVMAIGIEYICSGVKLYINSLVNSF